MDVEAVDRWMEAYRAAWISNVPSEVAALFTEDAVYSVSPFTEPLTGRDEIVRRWVAGIQQDVELTYEVLSVIDDQAIIHWHVFTRNVGDPRSGSSTTVSWCFASSPTAAVPSIASGTSDASSRGEPPAFSRCDLENGADVRSREEHTVR